MITSILIMFFVALVISLATTPVAGWFGRLIGAIDNPGERKVHKVATPRSGGAAIFVAFFVTVFLALLGKIGAVPLVWGTTTLAFLGGAVIVFATGFSDDVHRLRAGVKLVFQVIGATIAFSAGLRITVIPLMGWSVHSVLISYVLTVFWFVLLMNAVNLIDGLDGLAGGITFLACTIITLLLIIQNQYAGAVYFAVLAGSILGFLPYNFSRSFIFMGDGGSYFIGYAIAGLSIMGSTKIQVGAVILVILLAIGVPVFDTILSPIRRFIVGRKLFEPDKGHIHHKLVEMGFSARRVVLILYAISAILCVCSVFFVSAQNNLVGLFISFVGLCVFAFTHKLGYLRHINIDNIMRWFRHLMDVVGLSTRRRRFFGLTLEISKSSTMDELWTKACNAFEFLEFDRADFWLAPKNGDNGGDPSDCYEGEDRRRPGYQNGRDEISTSIWQTSYPEGAHTVLHWARGHYRRSEDLQREYMLKVELPISKGSPFRAKTLFLIKDTGRGPIDDVTLKRVGQLRETMMKTIESIEGQKRDSSATQPDVTLNPLYEEN